MKYNKYRSISWLMIIAFCHFCLFSFIPSMRQLNAADDESSAKLNKAEESYYDGNLNIALALVLECLRDSTISNNIRLRANKLLAHILLSKEESEAAKNALYNVLELEPGYQPTIEEEAPRYVALVEEARREISKQPVIQERSESGISSWVWLGAGGAAVAAAAIILISGGSGGSAEKSASLPVPPDLP